MSNVIKAAAVTYTQEKRTIDSNGRAEQFTRLFVEKHAKVDEQETDADENPPGFEPGILGLFTDRESTFSNEDESAENVSAGKNTENTAQMDAEAAERIREEAEEVLAAARQEVKEMLAQAKSEAAEIRKQAYADAEKKGYADGEKKAKEKYEAKAAQLKEETEAAKEAYERQAQELEPAFAELVIRLLKKLTGVLVEEKRDIVLYLLEQAVSGIESAKTYLIHVSPDDVELVNNKKSELLWKLKEGAELEVVSDRTLSKGQCMIETESRIFDCSIDTQLKNLSGDLRLLAGSAKE